MRQQYEGYYNIHALLHGLPSLKNQKEYQQKETFWRIRITIGKTSVNMVSIRSVVILMTKITIETLMTQVVMSARRSPCKLHVMFAHFNQS